MKTDQLQKKARNSSLWVLLLVLSLALLSCQPGIKEQALSDLKTKNAELLRQSVNLQSQVHLQQREIDSLNTIINAMEEQGAGADPGSAADADLQALRQLVFDMHESWKGLPERKDPQEILDYFLPAFMTNQINIDANNVGSVAGYTHEDYINYLEEIASRKRFSVEFGDVTFLDFEVKDKEFFNVAYKCLMRTYKKDELMDSSSVIVTMTGRKSEGEWKIANYSVVVFTY